MNSWAIYPAFIGTVLSVLGWSYFVARHHNVHQPVTLSELAARRHDTIKYFRTILWICGPLFLITILLYIAPLLHSTWLAVLWVMIVFAEICLGIFPPVSKQSRVIHNIFAYIMAVGMLLSAVMMALIVPRYNVLLVITVVIMILFSLPTKYNLTNYIYYELGYIFLSHISIIISIVSFV